MAPSDEGAVSEADWGRDRKKFRIIANFCSSLTFSGILSLRHGFAVPPPSSEGGFSICPSNSPINPNFPSLSLSKTGTFLSSLGAFPGGHNEFPLQLDAQPANQYMWLGLPQRSRG